MSQTSPRRGPNPSTPPDDSGRFDQPIPQNEEVERALLALVVTSQVPVERFSGMLDPRDFYRERHAVIWGAAMEVAAREQPVDLRTLDAELAATGREEASGGILYLSELVGIVEMLPMAMVPERVDAYARLIKESAQRRRLISAGGRIATLGYDTQTPPDTLVENAEAILDDLAGSGAPADLEPLLDALRAYVDMIAARRSGMGDDVVPTGFLDLDAATNGGFARGDLVVIGARPSIGKTSFALALAANMAAAGRTVAFFSLEMATRQIVGRLLSTRSEIDGRRLRRGAELTTEETVRLSRAIGDLAEMGLYIDASSALTVPQIRSRVRRLGSSRKVDVVVIDHLQLLKGTHRADRVTEMGEISRALKELAKGLDAPVIVLSQLSRAVEQRAVKTPILSDLRESGSIEQDADVVLLMYREDYYKRDSAKVGIVDIDIAKQRDGMTGSLMLYFNQRTSAFYNLEVETRSPP